MVLVDGHDSAWTTRFSAAIRDDSVIKLSLLHMNLNLVPWQLLWLSKNKQQKQQQKWQTVEVVDCRRLETGLTHILAVPIERLYISSSVLLSRQFGQILGLGLMESSKQLQHLHLSSCTWSVDAMKEFIVGLQATCVLKELNLSYTNWNTTHGRHHHHHHFLHSNDNDTCSSCIHYHFAQGLAKNTTLQCLKLNRCRLSDAQVAYLIEHGLMKHATIKELYLGGNELKQQTMTALAKWVAQPSCPLKVLEIGNSLPSDNNNNNQGQQQEQNFQSIFFQSLPKNTSLQVLYLASNRLTDDDMYELAWAIQQQSHIRTLDLKSNQLTNHGIQILASQLPSQLERLWLQGNPFGIDGAKALLTQLKSCHSNMMDLRIPTYNTLSPVPKLMAIQKEIHFYEALNKGGRRILMTTRRVPQGLWPIILERVNLLKSEKSYNDCESLIFDVIYTLLHGPVLLDR